MAHPPDPIDQRQPAAQEERIELSPYSSEWAKIVKPVTVSLLSLIAAVMLLPFVLVVSVGNGKTGDQIVDWTKTVLPPVAQACPVCGWASGPLSVDGLCP